MQQRPESRNWLYTPHGPDSLRGIHLARPDVSRPHGVRTHAGPGADGARAGEDPLSLRATLRSAHARDRLAREHQQVLPLTPLCAPPHARGSTVHGDFNGHLSTQRSGLQVLQDCQKQRAHAMRLEGLPRAYSPARSQRRSASPFPCAPITATPPCRLSSTPNTGARISQLCAGHTALAASAGIKMRREGAGSSTFILASREDGVFTTQTARSLPMSTPGHEAGVYFEIEVLALPPNARFSLGYLGTSSRQRLDTLAHMKDRGRQAPHRENAHIGAELGAIGLCSDGRVLNHGAPDASRLAMRNDCDTAARLKHGLTSPRDTVQQARTAARRAACRPQRGTSWAWASIMHCAVSTSLSTERCSAVR